MPSAATEARKAARALWEQQPMVSPTDLGKAVGVHRSTASKWVKRWTLEAEAEQRGRQTAAQVDADGYLDLSPLERARLVVTEIRQMIRIALDQEQTRDVASLFRRLELATEKLEALEAPEDDFDEWDPEQVAERIVQLLRQKDIKAAVDWLQRRDR